MGIYKTQAEGVGSPKTGDMTANSGHPPFQRRRLSADRQYRGSFFDVADARRFARVTASWWGVDAEPVEHIVDELARRAVCSEQPGFRVSLSLDGTDVGVRVEAMAPDAPMPEGPARTAWLRPRGIVRRH
jgi:hypothetical protein